MSGDNKSVPDQSKALRTASTVLLLREAAGGMEIFMVQRNRQIEFNSGALVFPGGSMDPGDREIAADPALVADRGGLDVDSAAIRIGGIRETFEESGILLGAPAWLILACLCGKGRGVGFASRGAR